MKLKIIQKTEKPLLLRTEVEVLINFEGKTPSKEEVKKLIVKELKSDALLTLVKKIKSYFGARKVHVLSYIYGNKDAMEKIEPKKKENAKGEKKEVPKEESKQEEEKKPEETKGEKKKESKEKPSKEGKKPEADKEKSKKEEKGKKEEKK